MSRVLASMYDSKTLYKRIVQSIIEDIRQGNLEPGTNLGSLEDLAARWGVSPGTVRQSLQILASAGLVTRKPRVGTVVSEAAPALARGDRAARVATEAYSLLVPNLDMPEYVALVRGLNSAARARGKQLHILSTSDDRQQFTEAIEASRAQSVSGIVLVPPSVGNLSAAAMLAIEQMQVPIVTCWRSLDCINAPMISSDPFDQMHTATNYLISLGMKAIGFVAGPEFGSGPHMSSSSQYGYERALLEARLKFSEQRIHIISEPLPDTAGIAGSDAVPKVRQQLVQWLEKNPDIEGVVCGNDLFAALLIRAAEELGRKVPDDLSVTGAGNLLPYFRQVVQSLTTLDVQIDTFGEKILEMLDEIAAGKQYPPGYRHSVKANLVIGSTTRKPAKTAGR